MFQSLHNDQETTRVASSPNFKQQQLAKMTNKSSKNNSADFTYDTVTLYQVIWFLP